jgi:hypothetical protein
MNDRKNPLVLGFLAAGIFLFIISFYLAYRTSTSKEVLSRLGQVNRETGQIFIIRSGFTQREKVENRGTLYNLDSIETNDTGEALISFESTFRVKVLEESLVTLERVEDSKNSHVILIIKKGDVKIENFGREGELYIAKNGERISAFDYEYSPLKVVPIANSTTIPEPTRQPGLTEEEISTVMNSNRSSFFKCYTQLLQKQPDSKGEVTLSLTIANSGKISVYDFTSAKLDQEDFKKCMLDVIARITFRPFQGPPVSTLFPLKFE